jgi:hypothetical protein
MNDSLGTTEFWSDAWRRHIESYLGAPPRTGHFLDAHFRRHRRGALELAGGSCRDSRHLRGVGWRAEGSDFDAKTIAYLRQRFPDDALPLHVANAFALPFPDGAYELSFHNGFWVCFREDADLRRLWLEQRRVTSRVALGFVHNALNRDQVENFARLAITDPLYDIRFFTPAEVLRLLGSFGVEPGRIRMWKFGGRFDKLYLERIRGRPNSLRRLAPRIAPLLYRWQRWEQTERIVFSVSLP